MFEKYFSPVHWSWYVLTIFWCFPASSYYDTILIFSTRVYSSTTWHPWQHPPRAICHIEQLCSCLLTQVIISSSHQDTILTQSLNTEVLSETCLWNRKWIFLSCGPVTISFSHFLPLLSIKHLNRPLWSNRSASTHSIQSWSNCYQTVSVSEVV